jgi:hypothetical protein
MWPQVVVAAVVDQTIEAAPQLIIFLALHQEFPQVAIAQATAVVVVAVVVAWALAASQAMIMPTVDLQAVQAALHRVQLAPVVVTQVEPIVHIGQAG